MIAELGQRDELGIVEDVFFHGNVEFADETEVILAGPTDSLVLADEGFPADFAFVR